MTTDLWQEARDLARNTANEMKRKQRDTREYVGDDGTRVKGWNLHSYTGYSKEKLFSKVDTDWEEQWGSHELVLGVDGKIYEWREDRHEYGEARAGGARLEVSKRLKLCPRGQLVGSKGKPFSELTGWLERLPYF